MPLLFFFNHYHDRPPFCLLIERLRGKICMLWWRLRTCCLLVVACKRWCRAVLRCAVHLTGAVVRSSVYKTSRSSFTIAKLQWGAGERRPYRRRLGFFFSRRRLLELLLFSYEACSRRTGGTFFFRFPCRFFFSFHLFSVPACWLGFGLAGMWQPELGAKKDPERMSTEGNRKGHRDNL